METATTEALAAQKTCARCDGQGRLYSKVTDRHDGPQCPTCRGRGVDPIRLGPQRRLIGVDDPAAQRVVHEILDDLHRLGLMRAEWASSRTAEGKEMYKEISKEIKLLYPAAYTVGLRQADIADALGITRQGLDLILHDRQRRR